MVVSLTSSLWYQKIYAGGSGLRDWFCLFVLHCWSFYTFYDIYWNQFCLLRCIVKVIHCTTSTVPSTQYTGLLSRYPPFYFKRFSLEYFLLDTKHLVLCTLKSLWDNTNNATIQLHKKIQSTQSKTIISHLWEITQVRLMVDPRSTCRSGEPWIRTCGTGGGKFQVFYLKVFVFSDFFFSKCNWIKTGGTRKGQFVGFDFI